MIVAITTEGPELSDRQYDDGARAAARIGRRAPRRHGRARRGTNNYDRSVVIDMGTRDTGGRNDDILTGIGAHRHG